MPKLKLPINIQIIAEQYPKSLLILDDVWSAEVARAFNVYCSTMVTSRNAKVVSGFTTPIYVSVAEGKCANMWKRV